MKLYLPSSIATLTLMLLLGVPSFSTAAKPRLRLRGRDAQNQNQNQYMDEERDSPASDLFKRILDNDSQPRLNHNYDAVQQPNINSFAATRNDNMEERDSAWLLSSVLSSSSKAEQTSKVEQTARLPQVLPGVDLPSPPAEIEIPETIDHPFVETRVDSFIGSALQGTLLNMLGKAKSDKSVTAVSKAMLLASQKIGSQINSSEYKFFGNGNHSQNLKYLLKTNPFMATAITERDGGFELRAFDKSDPYAEYESASLFRQIVSCLGGSSHRVNIRFDANMSIREIRVYEDTFGEELYRFTPFTASTETMDYWASCALYNLVYYASCVHGNIHVLHYLLTAALHESSQDFSALNDWAKFYATHVPEKYAQVGDLIRSQPNFFEIFDFDHEGTAETVADTYALLTGSLGFGIGSDGDKLRNILTRMLNIWTTDPTNYIDNMLSAPKDKLLKAGFLTEFMKHHDLVPAFAKDVADALESTDDKKFTIAEDRLKFFLNQCTGITSKIDTLEEWIQLMAVTGIVHGSTLSYTRLIADPDLLRWRDIRMTTWQAPDVNLHLRGLVTLCGMDEHRHVMSNSTDTVGVKYDEKLQEVLDTYAAISSDYKETYKEEIMKNTSEFNNYGWILSDFCPDGFDGKQLTVSAYI